MNSGEQQRTFNPSYKAQLIDPTEKIYDFHPCNLSHDSHQLYTDRCALILEAAQVLSLRLPLNGPMMNHQRYSISYSYQPTTQEHTAGGCYNNQP
jgi:hypothetical protein